MQQVATWPDSGILIVSGVFFVYLFVAGGVTAFEKKRSISMKGTATQ